MTVILSYRSRTRLKLAGQLLLAAAVLLCGLLAARRRLMASPPAPAAPAAAAAPAGRLALRYQTYTALPDRYGTEMFTSMADGNRPPPVVLTCASIVPGRRSSSSWASFTWQHSSALASRLPPWVPASVFASFRT